MCLFGFALYMSSEMPSFGIEASAQGSSPSIPETSFWDQLTTSLQSLPQSQVGGPLLPICLGLLVFSAESLVSGNPLCPNETGRVGHRTSTVPHRTYIFPNPHIFNFFPYVALSGGAYLARIN